MNLSALKSLQQRIREATGPDRELDAWIIVMLTPTKATADDLVYLVKTEPEDHCAPGTYWLKQRSGASLRTAPPLTSYPDGLGACVGLMHATLPGYVWGKYLNGNFEVAGPPETRTVWADALANDCLTFIDCIFSAAIAEEEAKEKADV